MIPLTTLDEVPYLPGMWQYPWLRIERAIRSVLADRLTGGATGVVDRVLMARIKEREQIERAGWFNGHGERYVYAPA